jgi:putative membrane protein
VVRNRKTINIACAGVLSIAVGFGSARAQSSPAKPTPKRQPAPSATVETRRAPVAAPPMDTHLFVVQAALANMAEIQIGHVAKVKAQRPEVKKFAQVMIDDYVNTQKELAETASGAGIKWPTQINDQHRQLKQRLSTVARDQFDREYLKSIVAQNRDVEQMLVVQMAGTGTPTDPALAAKIHEWAARTLPAVRAHLKEAEQLSGELDRTERSARR